jgi:uncharacterized protein
MSKISDAKKEKLTFIVYVGEDKQYRWKLVAPNNRNIANGGEGYENKADCLWAIELIRLNASDSDIRDKT